MPKSEISILLTFSCSMVAFFIFRVISARSCAFFFSSRANSIRISSKWKYLMMFPSASFSLFFSINAFTTLIIWLRPFSTTGFLKLFFFSGEIRSFSGLLFSSSFVKESLECLYPANSQAVLYWFSFI